jgi:hypothetical protein
MSENNDVLPFFYGGSNNDPKMSVMINSVRKNAVSVHHMDYLIQHFDPLIDVQYLTGIVPVGQQTMAHYCHYHFCRDHRFIQPRSENSAANGHHVMELIIITSKLKF